MRRGYDRWCWRYFELKTRVLARDGACLYCARPVDRYSGTIDHLVPRAMGGPDRDDNVVACCRECNRAKGRLLPLDFIWRRTMAPARRDGRPAA